MIPKGKFPWYSPDHALSEPAKSLFNSLTGIDTIPHIPAAVMELQAKVNDPAVETSEISKILKSDPVLAGEVLGMANRLKDARMQDGVEIRSLDHAVSYMGRKDVSQYILTLAIKCFTIRTKNFSSDRFWKESFDRARIAEFLAKKMNLPGMNLDELYLAAALCNIGKFVGAILRPEVMDQIELKISNPKEQCTWSEAELSFPAVNHVLLGEIAAAIWGLPDYIMLASRFHHSDPKPGSKLRSRVYFPELSSLANSLLHWISGEPFRIDMAQFNKLLLGFSLTEKDIENMIPEISLCLKGPR